MLFIFLRTRRKSSRRRYTIVMNAGFGDNEVLGPLELGQPPESLHGRNMARDVEAAMPSTSLGAAHARQRVRSRLFGVEPEPVTVGRFVLLEKVGVGAMGVVYKAYDPKLDRRVALKLVRTRDADPNHERLIREARALAKLSHPNVVAVHEVDTVRDGLFIAMEYIAGKTVGDWLADDHLAIDDILAVFVAAGRGLAAAHDAGVIHRDFKPDNAIVGNDGRVRVVDFGLAHAAEMAAPVTDESAAVATESAAATTDAPSRLTNTGRVVGTPRFMSPEQFAAAPTDHRSDQFSFAVALYEALYGESPFHGTTFAELARAVTSGEVRTAPANTGVSTRLRRVLLRGLAPRPDDRYPSMSHMLAELQPARKSRWGAVALGVAVLAAGGALVLAGGNDDTPVCGAPEQVLATLWTAPQKSAVERAFIATGRPHAEATFHRTSALLDAYRADYAAMHRQNCEATRVRAVQSEHLFDLRAQCLEQRRLELVELVRSFSGDVEGRVVDRAVLFAHALPSISYCADTEALSATVPLPEAPQQRDRISALRARLAEVASHQRAGRFKQALALATPIAAEAQTTDYGPVHAEALTILGKLQQQTGDVAACRTTLLEAAKVAAQAKDDRRVAIVLSELVYVTGWLESRYDKAFAIGEAANVAVVRAGDEPELRGQLASNLAGTSRAAGDYKKSLAQVKASLAAFRSTDSDHPRIAFVRSNMGVLYRKLGQYAESQRQFDDALSLHERQFGAEHPATAGVLKNIGLLMEDLGAFAKAEQVHRRALAIEQATFGNEHYRVSDTAHNLGMALLAQGKYDQAEDYLQQALAMTIKAFGDTDGRTGSTLNVLGNLAVARGQPDQARSYYQRALAIHQAFGAEHTSVSLTLGHQARLALYEGHYRKALRLFDKAFAIDIKNLGAEHPDTVAPRMGGAQALCNLGKSLQATTRFQKALTLSERQHGADHYKTAQVLHALGECYLRNKQPRKAQAVLDRALQIREPSGIAPHRKAQTKFALAKALWAQRPQRVRAIELAQEAHAMLAAIDHTDRREVRTWLRSHRL